MACLSSVWSYPLWKSLAEWHKCNHLDFSFKALWSPHYIHMNQPSKQCFATKITTYTDVYYSVFSGSLGTPETLYNSPAINPSFVEVMMLGLLLS